MEIKELDYETVKRAVHGDKNAQMKVLDHYDSYISALATVEEITPGGSIRCYVDETLKAEIQEGYLEALPKCKVMR